jgi:hypothetical protein
MTRLLLSLLVIAFFVLCAAGMRRGWRNRQRRQSHLPALPRPPRRHAAAPLLPPATGVYVGTTTAGDWQDRIAVGGIGLRSSVRMSLYPDGLLLDRTGATPLWIPADALVDARTDRALAGKVMGTQGLLVVRWRLGDHADGHLLDTGVRGDDKDGYGEWIDAVHELARRGAAKAGAQGGDDR